MSEGHFDQICIVCERGVSHPDIPEDILPGDLVICRKCDKITPDRRQAANHFWLRQLQKFEQANKDPHVKAPYEPSPSS